MQQPAGTSRLIEVVRIWLGLLTDTSVSIIGQLVTLVTATRVAAHRVDTVVLTAVTQHALRRTLVDV